MPMSNVQRTIAYNCAKIHRIKTPTQKNKNIVFLCHPPRPIYGYPTHFWICDSFLDKSIYANNPITQTLQPGSRDTCAKYYTIIIL